MFCGVAVAPPISDVEVVAREKGGEAEVMVGGAVITQATVVELKMNVELTSWRNRRYVLMMAEKPCLLYVALSE